MSGIEDYYKRLKKALNKGKRVLKSNNYKVRDIKCCENCDNVSFGYVDEMTCNLVSNPEYSIGEIEVESIGYCDKYKKKEW